MTDQHKETLTKHRMILVDNLQLPDLLTYLRAKGVVTNRDASAIGAKTTEHDQIEKLLDILPRKPESDYYIFISGLHATGQQHIAVQLEAEGLYKIMK